HDQLLRAHCILSASSIAPLCEKPQDASRTTSASLSDRDTRAASILREFLDQTRTGRNTRQDLAANAAKPTADAHPLAAPRALPQLFSVDICRAGAPLRIELRPTRPSRGSIFAHPHIARSRPRETVRFSIKKSSKCFRQSRRGARDGKRFVRASDQNSRA
ncbi:MAG: hypothetical protein FD160_4077, partial [Caulobacteraceae bacterium]